MNKNLLTMSIVFVIVLILFLVPGRNLSYRKEEISELKIQTPQEFLKSEILSQGLIEKDFLIMSEIIFCESSWSQYYKDGSVKVSNGNVGLAQINIGAHEKEYTGLGLNVYNEYDNLKYAVLLYIREGIAPWERWSGHCFLPKIKNL